MYNIVISVDIFSSRLNMWLMNRLDYFHILNRGLSLKGFFFSVATTMLIVLAAFGLKSAYRLHTQPWLLNNLSHKSSNHLTTSTHILFFSFFFLFFPPNLEIFLPFLCSLVLLQHSHRTYSKLMYNEKIQPLSMNCSTWYFKINI